MAWNPPANAVLDGPNHIGDHNKIKESLLDLHDRIRRSSAAPTSPVAGMIWIDTSTTLPQPKMYTGSAWVPFSGAMLTASDITAMTGSPTVSTFIGDGSNGGDVGVSYTVYQFAAAGGITVARSGLADVVVVGGGGGCGKAAQGGAGCVRWGMFSIPVGAHSVVVGAGGWAADPYGANGGHSALGSVLRSGGGGAGGHVPNGAGVVKGDPNGGGSGGAVQYNSWGGWAVGGGAGGPEWDGTNGGVVLSITGAPVEYGKSVYGATAVGFGSAGGNNQAGTSGAVIVRVRA